MIMRKRYLNPSPIKAVSKMSKEIKKFSLLDESNSVASDCTPPLQPQGESIEQGQKEWKKLDERLDFYLKGTDSATQFYDACWIAKRAIFELNSRTKTPSPSIEQEIPYKKEFEEYLQKYYPHLKIGQQSIEQGEGDYFVSIFNWIHQYGLKKCSELRDAGKWEDGVGHKFSPSELFRFFVRDNPTASQPPATAPVDEAVDGDTAIGLLKGFVSAYDVLKYNINPDLIERTNKFIQSKKK
jgi:hypothetical protein